VFSAKDFYIGSAKNSIFRGDNVKKIIFALAALLVLAFIVGCAPQEPGYAVYPQQEMPGYAPQAFMSLNSCHKACINEGFQQGTCKPVGQVANAEADLGPCVIDYSTSCAMEGQCFCYCYGRAGNVPTKGYLPS